MSRTTTDDCLENCPNHFNLAYHAATRAKQIMRRGDARLPEGEDKSVVVALREIARGLCEVVPMDAERIHEGEESAAPDETAAEAGADASEESADAGADEESAAVSDETAAGPPAESE